MANFQNFDIEISWGERVVKAILGTTNSSYANMHVWFTHSGNKLKKIYAMQKKTRSQWQVMRLRSESTPIC